MPDITRLIFAFFCLGFLGWAAESAQESIVRKRFISKGFFYGPIVPCEALGGLAVYGICSRFVEYPLLVFFAGIVIGTAVEYITALFLEKCFNVQCWDYRTYPHTRWCQFQGRICLTISLFFGLITLFVVYVFWDFAAGIADRIGGFLPLLDAALCAAFLADALISCNRLIRANKAGIKTKGYAVFSSGG